MLHHLGKSPLSASYATDNAGRTSTIPLDAIVVRTEVPSGPRFLPATSAWFFERNTRHMIAVCRVMGARVLLVTEPYNSRAGEARKKVMPAHNAVLRKIARDEAVMFYDFAGEMAKDDAHMSDGVHVNSLGSDLKRDLFFAFFVENRIIPKLRTATAAAGPQRTAVDASSTDPLRRAP